MQTVSIQFQNWIETLFFSFLKSNKLKFSREMLEDIEITDEVLEEVKVLRELITMLRDQISNLTPQSPKSHGQTMNVLITG